MVEDKKILEEYLRRQGVRESVEKELKKLEEIYKIYNYRKINQNILEKGQILEFLSGMLKEEEVIELVSILTEEYFHFKQIAGIPTDLSFQNPLFDSLGVASRCLNQKGLFCYEDIPYLPPHYKYDIAFYISREIDGGEPFFRFKKNVK